MLTAIQGNSVKTLSLTCRGAVSDITLATRMQTGTDDEGVAPASSPRRT